MSLFHSKREAIIKSFRKLKGLQDKLFQSIVNGVFMSENVKDNIADLIEDMVSDLLYYDRRNDEDFPENYIQDAVAAGNISIEDMVEAFKKSLTVALKN